MTRGKKLTILAIVLIIIIGGAVIASTLIKKNEENAAQQQAQAIADSTMAVFSANVSNISHAEWSYPDNIFSFTKSGESWADDNDAKFPASASKIETLLAKLSSVTSLKSIDSPADLGQFGLTAPLMTIKINDGTDRTLLIGNETGLGGQYYASNGDGNVYIIDSALPAAFSGGFSDVIELETIRAMTDLQSFTITRNGLPDFTIVHDGDSWTAYEEDSSVPSDSTTVHDFYKNLRDLRWSSVVTWSADEQYLEEKGLADPACTVTAQCTADDGTKFTQVFEVGNTFEEDESLSYCRLAGSEMVYLIESDAANAFVNVSAADMKS